MDLKALLVEAKQKVPPVLQVLQTGDETMLDIGGESFIETSFSDMCSFIISCPINTSHFRLLVKVSHYLIWWSHFTEITAKRPEWAFLTYLILVFPQGRGAVHSAAVSAIVLRTVPSWRPCRPSRSPTSGAKTTWLTAQWTFKSFIGSKILRRSTELRNISEETPLLYVVSLTKGSVFYHHLRYFSGLLDASYTDKRKDAFVWYIFDALTVNKTHYICNGPCYYLVRGVALTLHSEEVAKTSRIMQREVWLKTTAKHNSRPFFCNSCPLQIREILTSTRRQENESGRWRKGNNYSGGKGNLNLTSSVAARWPHHDNCHSRVKDFADEHGCHLQRGGDVPSGGEVWKSKLLLRIFIDSSSSEMY